jgi:DNA-binding NarL/FixJ family response regulator
MLLVDHAESPDVARLLNLGADALLLRTARADELADAVLRLKAGERVVASALAVGTIGRVGPLMDVSHDEATRRSGLSPKELEVLAELASGSTYMQIAEALIVTQATIKTHLVHIYKKLGVKNRHEAIARALALGLLG